MSDSLTRRDFVGLLGAGALLATTSRAQESKWTVVRWIPCPTAAPREIGARLSYQL